MVKIGGQSVKRRQVDNAKRFGKHWSARTTELRQIIHANAIFVGLEQILQCGGHHLEERVCLYLHQQK